MTTFDLMGDRSVGSLLAANLARRPSSELLLFLDPEGELTTHTYAGFSALLESARASFAELGVSDGAVVLSLLPNAPATYLTWFATSCNGAVHLPIDPVSGPRHVLQILRLATPTVAVVTPDSEPALREALESYDGQVHVVTVHDLALRRDLDGIEGLPSATAGPLPQPRANDDLAGLIQTSGTTGVPKLVEITHANYVFAGESLVRSTAMLPQDRHFIAMPMFHSGAQFFSTMPALVTGGSIAVVQKFSASSYFDQAARTESTRGVLLAPPMRMVLNRTAPGTSTGRMQYILYAQNLSDQEYVDWTARFPGVGLLQMYGSTETVALPIGRTTWNDYPLDSMGVPQIEREVALLDAEGKRTEVGPGEIVVRGVPGRTLMRGYYRNPEATAAALRDGWYHSGDFARRAGDGLFYFAARAQHVMRRGGENVSLPEVELHMQDCPMVSDVAARAIPDPVLEERLVAYVIPHDDFSVDAFIAWCREHIGRIGRPDDVVVMDEFPRTGVGKVRLGDLPLPEQRTTA